MIHQPILLINVFVNGNGCLVTVRFSAFWSLRRGLNARQRLARWLMPLVGVGSAFRGIDAWRQATEWPVQMAVHYSMFYYVGSALIAVALLVMMQDVLRHGRA
jgi:hypothetical protein